MAGAYHKQGDFGKNPAATDYRSDLYQMSLALYGYIVRSKNDQHHSGALNAILAPPKSWSRGRLRRTWLRTVVDDLRSSSKNIDLYIQQDDGPWTEKL